MAALAVAGCAKEPRPAPEGPPLFEQVAPASSGVTFANRLPDATAFDIVSYLYYYNGGGVAIGDVDGDGRPDLYFTANVGSNRLYLNRGGFRFEDVTARAGVADSVGWKTGVTMADVNGDGRLDLYVSGVRYLGQDGRNVLYVNRGDGTFADSTDAFGLGQRGFGTQSLFLDFDGDGDLDAYLLNHATHGARGAPTAGDAASGDSTVAADRLLRNDGNRFVDVSAKAGLVRGLDGFGLGVVSSDFNLDGCPDLYVANDFQEDDLLYLNRCDGTFTNVLARAVRHTSRFAMGVDAADVDDDGRPDLFEGDMLPEREDVLKSSASSEPFDLFDVQLRAGYHPQYERNALQLNVGDVDGVPRFAEVGFQAGVAATDWTWAPLFADLDDDGRKDLFVANGIYRRPNDLDYIDWVSNDAVQQLLARRDARVSAEVVRHMPSVPLANHAFRNEGAPGAPRFADAARAWGLAQPGFSTGAAYADLDGDGALDLVLNDVNGPARVYRNAARRRTGNAWLAVDLKGAGRNTHGLGAKVYATAGGRTQLVEQQPTRGFQSSVDPRLHFGLGRLTTVDTLRVVWPDRREQVLTSVPANRVVTLDQKDATGRWAPAPAPTPLYTAAAATLPWAHAEDPFRDTDREPLMPRLVSREGPAVAVGDVNGDGLDDVFLGGAKWQPSRLFVRAADGAFVRQDDAAFLPDSVDEDVRAAFFDADGDGDLDLYVATGGNEFWGDAPQLRDRLYLNAGGHLAKAPDGLLPPLTDHGGCVAPGDIDGDGDVDLFVGSRVVARAYGTPPASRLLRNDGHGRFADVAAELAPGLADVGMVGSCAWIDHAGRPALVVAGDWMAVRLFEWDGARLADRTEAAGLAGTEGWWASVTAADLDADGRLDLVLGNAGANGYVTANAAEPARMWVGELGASGGPKQVVEFFKHGTSYPVAGRDELARLIPAVRAKYPTHAAFGAATVAQIFPEAQLDAARRLEARTLLSLVAMQGADGRFTLRPLPPAAQRSTIRAALAEDVDGDGRADLLVAGNDFGRPPLYGRDDASYGLLLRALGGGRYVPVSMRESGLALDGQVRALVPLRGPGGERAILVARNGDAVQLLARRNGGGPRAARADRPRRPLPDLAGGTALPAVPPASAAGASGVPASPRGGRSGQPR